MQSRRVAGSWGEGRREGFAGFLHLLDWIGGRIQYTQIVVPGVVMRNGQDRCRAQVEQKEKGLTVCCEPSGSLSCMFLRDLLYWGRQSNVKYLDGVTAGR